MVPLQVIFLLVLASAPAALPPHLQFLSAPAAAMLLVTSHLTLIGYVGWRTRQALRLLHEPTGAAAISASTDRLLALSRWSTLLFLGICLYNSPLPEAIRFWLSGTYLLRYVPLFAEMLFGLPTFLTWLAFWTASYYLESANRERSLPYRLAQGLPAHPMPTLGQFLSMQIRHNFYILVPIAIHNAIVALGRLVAPAVPYAEEIAAPLGIVAVLLMTPWILAHVWSTLPLTGPLRAQLDGVAAAYRLRFRNILVWRTHNAVTNAAILGWVPFARYFLMTDALLETLSDRQLEAVFAHEVGHGVHRHILWYLGAMVGAVCLAYGAAVFWDTFLPPQISHFAGTDVTPGLVSLALIGLFLAVGFPWMSHRFEHQADYFASLHMARQFQENPALEGPIPQQLLPPEIGGGAAAALSLLTTPAEVVTLQQYIAGFYPHAAPPDDAAPASPGAPPEHANALTPGSGESLAASLTDAPPVMPQGRPASRGFTPAQAGAEMFISALDTILELSHRARNRGGWMHPSPNSRINLLRRLATHPLEAAQFSRRMLQTRLVIVLLMLAGLTAGTAGIILEARAESHPTPATAPTAIEAQ